MRLIGSLLFLTYFTVASTVLYVGLMPLLLAPRIIIVRATRFWAWMMLWGLRVFCGQTYEVRGRENILHGKALIASKHFSMWEIFAFWTLIDYPSFVLKRELMWIPFSSWYATKMGMIPIDRSAKASAMRALRRASQVALGTNSQIIIFPEGTRRQPGDPPVYLPGIAGLYTHLGVPCIPVTLNSALFWQKRRLLKHPGKIVIEFLPAIQPGLKREAFMEELETRIETATNKLLGER